MHTSAAQMTSYTILLILLCLTAPSSSSAPLIAITVTGSHVVSDLPGIWSSTGFSPPDPHERIPRLLSSNDMHQNMGLIGSLPAFSGRREVRVDWLLDLVSIRKQQDNFVDYRFDHLDDFIQLLYDSHLRPCFKLMGNPSKFFSSFEDETQLIIWWDMVKSIATRYITKYGFDYVREWNFESWKSPDRWDFDGINMTADGFINYIESSYQGLLSASLSLANNKTTYKKRDLLSPNLRFGGPAGKCIPMTNDSLCGLVVDRLVKKLTESDGAERLNLFFSFEERGEKRVSEGLRSILDKETLVLSELSERLTGMTAEVEVMNSEADSEAGWSTPRSWQADAHYAALVARSMALHVEEYFLSRDTGNETGGSGPRFRFSSLNYENAYMSNFPHQFTQRTLLARFQVNNTFPPFVQFVKKPVFLVYGLMGLLGDQLLQHRMASANQTHVKIIATSAHDNQRNQKAYSFLVVNSLDQPVELTNGSIRVNVTLNFSLSDLNYEWRMSRYTVDNVRTNPYKVWKDQGSRPFFTHRLLSAMRVKSEPAMDISAEEVQIKVSADGFDHQTHLSFDLPQPAVTLILLCSKSDAGPDKVVRLRGVTVNEFEVLLLWSVSKSRCLKTYEVEFADTASVSRQFERVSSDVLLFASFNYLRKGTREGWNATGEYRVREVDMFGRKGQFSDVLSYAPEIGR